MTELEQIAQELGSLVSYWTDDYNVNTIEKLAYRDNNSQILARDDFKDEYGKVLWYYVDILKIDIYSRLMRELGLDLSSRISDKLDEFDRCSENPPNIAQRLVSGSVDISNFNELSAIIRAHSKMVND